MKPLFNEKSSKGLDDFTRLFAGPTGLDHFNREIRERKYAHFPAVFSKTTVADFFSTEILAQLFLPNSTAIETTEVYSNNYLVRLVDILHKTDCFPLDVILEQLNQGTTIRVRNIERYLPNMQSFSTSVSHNFHCKANINAYLTPTGMKGFPPHFDNTDVFILQTLGVKHWNIFEDYSNSMELPLRDTPWNPDKYHPGVNKQLVELHPGDILYIPRGGMHSAACRAGLSLHLTISLDTDPIIDKLSELMHEWARQDVRTRRRLPDNSIEAKTTLLELAYDFHRWLQDNSKSINVTENRIPDNKAAIRKFCHTLKTMNTSHSSE